MSRPSDCAARVPVEQNKVEVKTRYVVGLTALMMVAELIVGYMSHSLSLTADGWHMATHVGALGLTSLAYWYARTRSNDNRFAFGTGKVYALSGYTSAGLLMAVSVSMVWSAVDRFFHPVAVQFAEAMPVAVLGLLVNFVCAWLLQSGETHDHSHDHSAHAHEHHDSNLKAAYIHVLADALTSVFAIAALLAGRYSGWYWVDALVGALGAVVIFRWAIRLLAQCGEQLLDIGPWTTEESAIRVAIEDEVTRVSDIHVWRFAHDKRACVITVLSEKPKPIDEYRSRVFGAVALDHLTIEVRNANLVQA